MSSTKTEPTFYTFQEPLHGIELTLFGVPGQFQVTFNRIGTRDLAVRALVAGEVQDMEDLLNEFVRPMDLREAGQYLQSVFDVKLGLPTIESEKATGNVGMTI